MNLDNLLKEMKEKMQERDLSDKYLEENRYMTRTEMGIGEYGYGITTVPCEWVYNFLSDYKKLKEDFNKANNIAIKNMTEYVSKKEIKDKIEELRAEYEYLGEENKRVNKFEIELLQELLEEEGDK